MDEQDLPEEEKEPASEEKERSISSDLIRGHINTIILRALYDGDKYGYEIISEIEQKSAGQYSLKQPSLYSALKRLEKDGYVTSYWGGSVSGGRRKYFSLTDEGKAISEQNQAEWEYSRTIIDSLISDKDFDFSNPAPTAVNMRVLRDTTSRVPGRDEEEGEEDPFVPIYDDTADREKLNEEFAQKTSELESQYAQKTSDLESEYAQKTSELESQYAEKEKELEALYGQRTSDLEEDYKRKSEELEAEKARIDEEKRLREAQAQAEREAYEEAFRAQSEAHESALIAQREAGEEELRSRLANAENELTYRDRIIEEERKHIDDIRAAQAEEANARLALEQEIQERDRLLEEERTRHAQALAEERKQAESERLELTTRYSRELLEREALVRQEMEEEFRKRREELIRQNYLNLVTAPPLAEGDRGIGYPPPAPAEAPAPATAPAPTYAPTPAPAREPDYRTVVHKMYADATATSGESTPRAKSIDGIDFNDLETRASQDHIRLVTSGGNRRTAEEAPDRNIVHKGKALFLSAIVAFVYCIALGAVVLALQKKLSLPLFFPYFIWGAGLALLLVTGLAYANRYGERTLRRSGPALINAIVIYALLVIVTLIVALAVRIDFTDLSQLSTYVIIPAVFFVAEFLFGMVYYLLLRPAK